MRKSIILLSLLVSLVCFTSCSISYQLNGASIDYSTTHTISFDYIQNKASLVYAPLTILFNDELQDSGADTFLIHAVNNKIWHKAHDESSQRRVRICHGILADAEDSDISNAYGFISTFRM